MKQTETYNGDAGKIFEHGESLLPKEKFEYYSEVFKLLYVVRGAFKRDLYMEDQGLKKRLQEKIEEAKNEMNSIEETGTIVKIAGKYGLVDITRIFEAMKEAGIISKNTEVSQVAQIFFREKLEQKEFALKYNATKNDVKKNFTNSNSKELLEFIKILINKSYNKKESELYEIEKHVSDLQNNLI